MKKLYIFLFIIIEFVLCLYISTYIVYNSIFSYRCETIDSVAYNMEDFENLERKRYEFTTRNGDTLVGYLYFNKFIEEKGLVIFAHGLGGGGQVGYIDIFDYLSSNGYYVFAYDATGNDESEGQAIGGLPQGIIDLDYAINYTKTIDEVKDLPLMLMGYSWGGFSVSNVLNYHDEVKAVVSIAGWNESENLIEYYSSDYVGVFSKVLLPFVDIYEYLKYGEYSKASAMKSFENTDAKVMIIHSEDDETVPIKYGYDTYYEKLGQRENVIFKHYDNRGHTYIFRNKNGILDSQLFLEITNLFDSCL